MKSPIAALPVFLLFLCVTAATNEPPLIASSAKIKATVKVEQILRPDIEIQLPDGKNKKQYFEVVDRHILTYSVNGKAFSVTNDMPTGRIVLKRVNVIDAIAPPSVFKRQ